jgi:sulfite exporter TauE/SafE
MHLFAEAALLGLASGPACLAACGPVLLPALAAQGQGLRGAAGLLSVFLAGRLAGYLSFSVLAWTAGLAAPADPHSRALLFGLVDLSLAGALTVYALVGRECPAARGPSASSSRLVSIEKRVQPWGPAALGLLTGLNICPPFLVAGARAAETRSLPAAVAFFLVFFLGTAVWSLPLVAVGWLRRLTVVAAVARITLLILAAWYAYLGIIALLWRFTHA